MKKIEKRFVAAFQIFLLVVSLAAFSYFVGNEFRFVSAVTGEEEYGICPKGQVITAWTGGIWKHEGNNLWKCTNCNTKSWEYNDGSADLCGYYKNNVGWADGKCDGGVFKCKISAGGEQSLTEQQKGEQCGEGQGTCMQAYKTGKLWGCPGTFTPVNPESIFLECKHELGGIMLACCKQGVEENGGTTDEGGDVDLNTLLLGGLMLPSLLDFGLGDPVTSVPSGLEEAATAIGEQAATTGAEAAPDAFGAFLANLGATWWYMLANAAIAAGIGIGFGLIGEIDPEHAEMWQAFGFWTGLGYGVGSTVAWMLSAAGLFSIEWAWLGGPIGFILATIGFFIFYRDEKIVAVVFSCGPWQPQTGGADCGKCNDGQFPCTEYKCQSLGQGCELLNKGTDEEKCVWNNRNDIAPPTISSWDEPLQEGYHYEPDTATLPPDKGVIIKYDSADGCAPPFSRIDYGIELDKPGRCRIDIVRKNRYDDMMMEISSGFYKETHPLLSTHAGVSEAESEGISFPNGGNFEIYVRCQSSNGHSNEGTFIFKYCVQDEPDTTPPTIVSTDPINGVPIGYGQSSIDVNVYVNKPSDCRWSHNDEDYNTMAGTMSCASSITEMNAQMLYTCTTTLDGLKDETENKFYFRCKSYPTEPEADRYKNEESYVYKLIGTRPLVIDWVKPQDIIIKDSTDSINVKLEAHTSAGYKSGEAKCYFKEASESDANYVLFMNTNSHQHSQDLWLSAGSHSYSVRCCDAGGNCDVELANFEVETDFDSPIVVRVYNEATKLKIITNEKAECVYDITNCGYTFDDGVAFTTTDNREHIIGWNTANNFYIKCQDEFGNKPAPDECSIIVRPFSTYE